LAIAAISSRRTHSRNVRSKRTSVGFVLSSKLMRMLVLQFDGLQMIADIVLGSILPCLRFSALPPIIRDFALQFVTCIVSGCRNEFHAHTKDCALSNDYLKVHKFANRAVAKCIALCHPSRLEHRATAILYIPKVVLLRVRRLHRTRLGQTSGTREGRFGDSNLSSL